MYVHPVVSQHRKRHDRIGNPLLIWRCCVCLQRENSCFSLSPIYIYLYIFYGFVFWVSLLQPSCRFSLHSHVVVFVLYSSSLSLSLSLCLAACLSLPVFLTVFQHTLRCCHIPSPSALSFHQQAALFWSLESGRTSLNTEGDKDISCCYCLYLNEQLETVLFFFCSHFKQQKPIEGSICSEVNALIKKAAIH